MTAAGHRRHPRGGGRRSAAGSAAKGPSISSNRGARRRTGSQCSAGGALHSRRAPGLTAGRSSRFSSVHSTAPTDARGGPTAASPQRRTKTAIRASGSEETDRQIRATRGCGAGGPIGWGRGVVTARLNASAHMLGLRRPSRPPRPHLFGIAGPAGLGPFGPLDERGGPPCCRRLVRHRPAPDIGEPGSAHHRQFSVAGEPASLHSCFGPAPGKPAARTGVFRFQGGVNNEALGQGRGPGESQRSGRRLGGDLPPARIGSFVGRDPPGPFGAPRPDAAPRPEATPRKAAALPVDRASPLKTASSHRGPARFAEQAQGTPTVQSTDGASAKARYRAPRWWPGVAMRHPKVDRVVEAPRTRGKGLRREDEHMGLVGECGTTSSPSAGGAIRAIMGRPAGRRNHC